MTDARDKFAALAGGLSQPKPAPEPAAPVAPAPAPAAPVEGEILRMLGGRVPDSVFREFGAAKGDAEVELRVRKITNEAALEAFVRVMRQPAVWAAWTAELQASQRDS